MAPADRPGRTRLCVYNAGFFKEARVRRILQLAGWDAALGLPKAGDWVGIWGRSPTSYRGEAVSERRDSPILRVEDAFLRSVLPGRSGEPPMGLILDELGLHFDASRPSRLESILADHPLDEPDLLKRARTAIDRLSYWKLSKYACWDVSLKAPADRYVLLIDQTKNDAALPKDADTVFQQMLADARADHPELPIVIRAHPESAQGYRDGHFQAGNLPQGATLVDEPISPQDLFANAQAAYTVSSTLGFEAILAGHRPVVYGQPFYAGWNLTDDRGQALGRNRALTPQQMFAAAMILAPTWYDPFRDRLCELEDVIDALSARATAWRQDRNGWVITNMSAWKRPHLTKMFGGWGPVECRTRRQTAEALARQTKRPLMVWANDAGDPDEPFTRIEDGFLRSPGLGASLVPPSSLGLDDLGVHFDPKTPSRLERLIAKSPDLPLGEIERAAKVIEKISELGLTKYNIKEDLPALPKGEHRILVVGQVDDDAAVLRSRPDSFGNGDLLNEAKARNPDAVLIYKGHPDVEAGLRRGKVANATQLADKVLTAGDPAKLIEQVDEVWTISSTMGFEALLRGVPVTCLGAPFYAGWGLTTDLGPVPSRRKSAPSLEGLTHAALIGYTRYFDPVTLAPCPVEVALDRLAQGIGFRPPGLLARLQRLKALIR